MKTKIRFDLAVILLAVFYSLLISGSVFAATANAIPLVSDTTVYPTLVAGTKIAVAARRNETLKSFEQSVSETMRLFENEVSPDAPLQWSAVFTNSGGVLSAVITIVAVGNAENPGNGDQEQWQNDPGYGYSDYGIDGYHDYYRYRAICLGNPTTDFLVINKMLRAYSDETEALAVGLSTSATAEESQARLTQLQEEEQWLPRGVADQRVQVREGIRQSRDQALSACAVRLSNR